MNPKNTFTLALTLGLLMLGLYVVRSRSQDAPVATPTPARGTVTSRSLIEDPPGEVVKISLKRPDQEAWLFEKKSETEGDTEVWYMTAPGEFKAVSWEVEKLPRQLGSLMYDISYESGQVGAVTAERAGLAPPRAVISLSDRDGKNATVEIGGPAGSQETYVRLVGSSRICVGKSSLSGLFKDKPIEYREKLLWTFDANDATRLEVDDRESGTSYVFSRDGARWMIESPVGARGTDKVQEAVTALARLRVIQWHENDPQRLPVFGLSEPALTVRVTVEETAPELTEGDTEEETPSPPVTEQSVYVLQVSDRAPIGEETKSYVSVGEDASVGTIMKTTVDKIKPVMSEWRDRRLTPLDATASTEIALSNGNGLVEGVLRNGTWERKDGTGTLETEQVSALLSAIQELAVTAYVDGNDATHGEFGFTEPAAVLTLTIPGATSPERLAIGSFTDTASKRLRYARRNDETSVGKVRAADVEMLLQEPNGFADRTVFDLPPSGVIGVSITSHQALHDQQRTLSYGRQDGSWSMTAPVTMTVDQDSMNAVVSALAGLRSERVVSMTDVSSAYGLHDPSIVVAITTDMTLGSSASDNASETSSTLALTKHDGKWYGKRADSPTIFEIAPSLAELLNQNHIGSTIWSFDPDAVTQFRVNGPNGEFAFERSDETWRYSAEPDLPLDTEKVNGLLLRLRDLRVVTVADYGINDLAQYGLDDAAHRVSVVESDAEIWVDIGQSEAHAGNLFAKTGSGQVVFQLEANAIDRLSVSLDELESTP